MRLPRPCRLRIGSVRPFALACEVGIGEPLASNLAHSQREAVCIVQRIVTCGAVVEPKNLLIRSSLIQVTE